MNDIAFIAVTTPKYKPLKDLWEQSLLNLFDESCLYIKELPDPNNFKDFLFLRHHHTIDIMQEIYDNKKHEFVAFTDCDIVFKADAEPWWHIFYSWFRLQSESIAFMKEGSSPGVNCGFFIMKQDGLPIMINFLKFVISQKDLKIPMPHYDQTIVNMHLQKINFCHIPDNFVVWGPQKQINNSNCFLFHHAVCTTSMEEKIKQIYDIKRKESAIQYSSLGPLKIYYGGQNKNLFGASFNDTIYSSIFASSQTEMVATALSQFKTFRIVVSHYNENLSWLIPYAKYCTIYNKGTIDNNTLQLVKDNANLIHLPNVGREAHTYLWYIVTNYEYLPDWIIFTQGNCHPHVKINQFTENILIPNEHGISSNYKADLNADVWNFNITKWGTVIQPSNQTFGEYWKKYIQKSQENVQNVYWGAIFSVSKEKILQNSKDYYVSLLETVSQSIHPESAHFLERSWYYIFH